MKVNGNTIILDAGEQITIVSQEVTQTQQATVEPVQNENFKVNLIVKNETGKAVKSTGEIRLYVNNHIGIDTYLPGAFEAAGPKYTFSASETNFSTEALVHGDNVVPTQFNNATVNEVRFYDHRHWNNVDAGFNAVLDTTDSRCDKTLKAGGTYVIKITNI